MGHSCEQHGDQETEHGQPPQPQTPRTLGSHSPADESPWERESRNCYVAITETRPPRLEKLSDRRILTCIL